MFALGYYSRIRFIANLLPLLQNATSLRRVVFVAGGGNEGHVDTSDFQGRRVPLLKLRGHFITIITLSLEIMARTAPNISFVHDFPGSVNTALFKRTPGVIMVIMRTFFGLFGRWLCVPIEECGERHLYLATSARYPPKSGMCPAVPLNDGIDVAQGTTGQCGSGVYSILWDCESCSPAVRKLLAGYRDDGTAEEIWRHTESEFNRITG